MALLDVDEATERFKKKLEEGYFDDKGLSDEEIQTMMKTLVEADKEQGMNRDTLEQDPCNTCGYEEGSIYCKEHCPHEAKIEQEPCDDAISRQAALGCCRNEWEEEVEIRLKSLPPVNPQPKTWHCKDCKWWKDSDGEFRRGVGAESKCPINRQKVFEGNGYCYMFESQESEE